MLCNIYTFVIVGRKTASDGCYARLELAKMLHFKEGLKGGVKFNPDFPHHQIKERRGGKVEGIKRF
jgi:hypothetical protein